MQNGEPIDRTPWGELEPEEGQSHRQVLRVYAKAYRYMSVCRRRIGRRIGGGRGRRSRRTSTDRWLTNSFRHANAIWHGKRRFYRCWGSRDSRLLGVAEECWKSAKRGRGQWSKVTVSGRTGEADCSTRAHGQRARIRRQCCRERWCCYSSTGRGTGIKGTFSKPLTYSKYSCILSYSGKPTVSIYLSMQPSSKVCRKTSCAEDTTNPRVVLLASLVQMDEKTSQT